MDNLFEVFNFRHFENTSRNGSIRRGYFDIRFYIGNTEWVVTRSFKLYEKDGESYVLPPAEKNKNGRFDDFVELSGDRQNGLRLSITEHAVNIYKTLQK